MSCGQPPRLSGCWCQQRNCSRWARGCPALPCSHGKDSRVLVTSPGHCLHPPALHTPADTPAPGMDPHSPRAELALAGVWKMLLVLGDCLRLAQALLRHSCPLASSWAVSPAGWLPGAAGGGRKGRAGAGGGMWGGQYRGQMEEEALSTAKSCKSPLCRLAGAAWQGQSRCGCQGPGSASLCSLLAPGEKAQGWLPLPHRPLHPPPAMPWAAPAHPAASIVPTPRSRTGTLQGHSLCGPLQSSQAEGSGCLSTCTHPCGTASPACCYPLAQDSCFTYPPPISAENNYWSFSSHQGIKSG